MEGLATEAGKQLLTQGILGVLCLLLMVAVIYLYRERRAVEEARLTELSRIIEARESIAKVLGANTLAMEANNKASEARTRATEDIAREVADLRMKQELAAQQHAFDLQNIRGVLEDIKKRRGGSA